MAKSKILKELANNEITIDVALSRLLIISRDIDNSELLLWANNELTGYKRKEELPEYRKVRSNLFAYSGINGSYQVKNQPLPIQWFSETTRASLNPINLYDSIAVVQEIADKKEITDTCRDLTYLAGEIEENTDDGFGGIQCFSIVQKIPQQIYKGIVSQVRTKLLNVFIELDKAYGNLDDLDINLDKKTPNEIAHINQQLITIIDNSIHIGDGNEISKSNIHSGGDDGKK